MKRSAQYFWSLFPAIVIAAVFSCIWLAKAKNPLIPVNVRVKKTMHNLLPQGWAFFTKDPRTKMYDIYKEEDDHHLIKINFKTSEAENLFGLSRKSIKIKSEIAGIASAFPDSLWKVTMDKNDFNTPVNIQYKYFENYPCIIMPGKYLIVAYDPVPLDSIHNENYHPQFKFIHITLDYGETY